jgi:hypothetical protein
MRTFATARPLGPILYYFKNLKTYNNACDFHSIVAMERLVVRSCSSLVNLGPSQAQLREIVKLLERNYQEDADISEK